MFDGRHAHSDTIVDDNPLTDDLVVPSSLHRATHPSTGPVTRIILRCRLLLLRRYSPRSHTASIQATVVTRSMFRATVRALAFPIAKKAGFAQTLNATTCTTCSVPPPLAASLMGPTVGSVLRGMWRFPVAIGMLHVNAMHAVQVVLPSSSADRLKRLNTSDVEAPAPHPSLPAHAKLPLFYLSHSHP
jgi:hypothetical protein